MTANAYMLTKSQIVDSCKRGQSKDKAAKEDRLTRAQVAIYVARGYRLTELMGHVRYGSSSPFVDNFNPPITFVDIYPAQTLLDLHLDVRRLMREWFPWLGWQQERELRLL